MLKASQLLTYRSDPAAFRRDLVVDANGQAVCLGDVLDPWQDADFRAMDSAWLTCAGIRPGDGLQRAFLERGRGHSKSSDIGLMGIWALFFAPSKVTGIAAAADKEQAALLRDRIDSILRLNPLLNQRDSESRLLLDVQRYQVVNHRTGSTLRNISSDVGSSYGHLADFVVCDELSHWPTAGGEDLWTSLVSTASKRERCLLAVITNAGFGRGTSWQWRVREACRQDERWYFSRLDGPQASWITAETLAEQQRLLPPGAYRRLWENEWVTESGDALSEADVRACVTLDGPSEFDNRTSFYVAGLDLGLKHDHSGLVVIGCDVSTARCKLVHSESWAPPYKGGQVNIAEVETACRLADLRYRLDTLVYDPWQAEYLAQRLRGQGICTTSLPSTSKNLDAMATRFLEVITTRTIDLYDDEDLIRDLLRLNIQETTAGFKIRATRDEHGHCDRATALILALTIAYERIATWQLDVMIPSETEVMRIS